MNTHRPFHTPRLVALACIASLGTLAATPALAQDDSYFYGGLSLGSSRGAIDQDRITEGLLGQGLTVTDFSRDQRSRSYRLFGGYQMNRYLGVEAGFFDLGKFGFSATTAPAGTLDGQIKLRGLNLDLVGTLPISDSFSLLGRVGVHNAKASDHFAGSGAVAVLDANPSQRQTNAKIGAGLQYEFSRAFLMRAEVERYRVNDAVGNKGDVVTYGVSLVMPFGRAPAALPAMAAAPAYVAPPPPPPPPPAPPPPPPPAPPPPPPVVAAPPVPRAAPVPVRQRVSFEAESLFGFDQSGIKTEGRAALDRFAAETKGLAYEVITVEGHTDRLGSEAYNQKLSLQRAEAVKSYLVTSGGFAADKVQAVGKGESQPVTKPEDCKGTRASAALVACLQPDRRVEIEVNGTR